MLNRFFTEIYSIFIRYKLYHVTFWIIYTAFWSFLLRSGVSWSRDYFNTSVILFFHILVSYFNNYFLIEWFLFKRRFISYFSTLLLSVLMMCFPISMATYLFIPLSDESIAYIWSLSFYITNFLYISFTVLVAASVKLFRTWYLREQQNKNLEKLNIENELQLLKSQINPHFLFNNLNNLYALTLKQSDLAPEVVLKLSNILRFGLYETQKNKVSLNDDIQFARDYIELEKLRLGTRTQIDFEVIGDTNNINIAPFLFINFIENAFKHGANPTLGNSYIKLNYEVENSPKTLIFTIENNKPKMLNNIEKTKVGGIGLKNVQTRLNILYPNKHEIIIENELEYFKVKLKIQLL